MLIFSNARIEKIPSISAFLQEELQTHVDYAVGWGRKVSYAKAKQLAQQKNIKSLCVEDGFVRSMGLGKLGHPPCSVVVDHQGIYFDAAIPSDLECLIKTAPNDALMQRAKYCIDLILKYKITKYNQKYQSIPHGQFQHGCHVLVVDQTYGDQSISYAGADASHFKAMLEQACQDHPHAQIWFKLHPDVLSQRAKGHLSAQQLRCMQAQYPNLNLLTANYNPIELLEQMHEVYVVSSQLGFEALLCQKKVHCFALPWYAGWGLTQDQHAPVHILEQRREAAQAPISLTHVFACAYLQYARYISPLTGERCQLEDWLELLVPNLNLQAQLSPAVCLYGFSPWKKTFIKQYLNFPELKIRFQRYIKPAKTAHVVAWGAKAQQLRRQGYKYITTVEDGFIRSIGLGAKLIRPCSLVFDAVGIYYDATRPSQLEQILNHIDLNSTQLQRIQQLRKKILALNMSKYNVGEQQTLDLGGIQQKKILVVGQVEDDLSIQLGGLDIKSNTALLKQVRSEHPDAYIIYKPHPDVVAGLRVGAISKHDSQQYADCVESHISITRLYSCIDELHTISSLSGFEALIRGVTVYCYGMPFYAGWGLTHDRHSNGRRLKQLTVNELMHGVIVDYPTYNHPDPHSQHIALSTPEAIIDHLSTAMMQHHSSKSMLKTIFLSSIRLKQRL